MFLPAFESFGLPEIISVAGLSGLILISINYLWNYLPLSRFQKTRLAEDSIERPISIIICARNEDENLTEFLPSILTQEYPDFEVIVVNDCSIDNTETVIDEFAKIFPNLRKANIKEDEYYKHGKKFAVLVGIKAARHNHIVFTDADCHTVGKDWLRSMAKGFTAEREIVIGYGGYEKAPGLLNQLIRYDTASIAVQYLSAAIKGKGYMAVGRNLAYTKDLFFRNKGFSSHYHLASGDDDLFVNQTATAANLNVCVDEGAITLSKPKTTFRNWKLQKARHLTTAPFYKPGTKTRIIFNYFSQYYFYLTVLLQFFSMNTLVLVPIYFLLKAGIQIMVMRQGLRKLGERDLMVVAPVLELLLILIYPIFHLTKLFGKKNQWNP